MCGIFGVNRHLDRESISEISGTLLHRGPDEEGYFTNENFSLIHKRLKVIDLKTGRQPIFNEDNTKGIIFNGEIFNYQELKNNLLKQGHKFKTNTDTEVALHL
ncbi:MAG: asparagine synthetase B, partial [Candidatus Omnitrophica bacterium]|nr:asparagine synthetase B [Candidatus Omnitrophota bacterium]